MRSIVEKMMELEFQDLNTMLEENMVDEGLKDIWRNVKDKVKVILHKIKNRVIMCFSDGTAVPAVSPLTSGYAIKAGEAGKSTFYVGADSSKGIKTASMNDIIKDFENNKKSIFEGKEKSDEEIANLLEASAALSLSGAGKYGPDVDTEGFKFYLNVCIKKGEKGSPLLVWGAPGIGKTAIVKAVLRECYGKKALIVKNLGQCQKDDFTLPAFEKDLEGRIIGADEIPKTWLPMYRKTGDPAIDAVADNIANGGTKEGEIGQGGVIFFDEIARCAPDVQAVALTLIEDRQLVGYTLGSKWSIVAASNREIDDPNMDITLSKALGNRFSQFNFVPSFDDWADWASKQEYMNTEVVNFLKFNQKYWYLMHPEDDDEKVFASPRSWTKCCQMLYNISCGAEEDGWSLDDVPFNRIQEILLQYVQPEVATEFMTYYKLTRAVDIHALHDVFKNPKKAPDLKKGKDGKDLRTDIKYYMVAKVLSGLDPNKMPEPKEMENLAIWLVTSKDESVAAAALHTLFEMYPDIRFQLGNPECQNLSGYENTWNKYINMTMTLIQGIPGMDKEMDVTL